MGNQLRAIDNKRLIEGLLSRLDDNARGECVWRLARFWAWGWRGVGLIPS